VRGKRRLRIDVEDRHGHQFRQYVDTFEHCGFAVGRLGDPAEGRPDVILQMNPRTRLHPDAPTIASVHYDRLVDDLLTGSEAGHVMAARFRHWLVKRACDAKTLVDLYGVEAGVAPYFYADLADAPAPDPDAPHDLLCASYVNRFAHRGGGRGWEVFREVRDRLGARCVLYGTDAPSGAVRDDAARFRRARFTLHVKHHGYVCNAVVRSLAAGVPVVMDAKTWDRGRYEGVLDPDGGIAVLSGPDEIVAFMEETRGDAYAALVAAAWAQGERFRRPPGPLGDLVTLVLRCAGSHG
jgi:hypothetical protein